MASEVLMDRYAEQPKSTGQRSRLQNRRKHLVTDAGLRGRFPRRRCRIPASNRVEPDGAKRIVAEFELRMAFAFSPDERAAIRCQYSSRPIHHAIELEEAGNWCARICCRQVLRGGDRRRTRRAGRSLSEGRVYCTGPGLALGCSQPTVRGSGNHPQAEIPAHSVWRPRSPAESSQRGPMLHDAASRTPSQPQPWYRLRAK